MGIARLASAAALLLGLALGLWSPRSNPPRVWAGSRDVYDPPCWSEEARQGSRGRTLTRRRSFGAVRRYDHPDKGISSQRVGGTRRQIYHPPFRKQRDDCEQLRYPGRAGTPAELVRHYSFSSGDRLYSCDFGQGADGSKLNRSSFTSLTPKAASCPMLILTGMAVGTASPTTAKSRSRQSFTSGTAFGGRGLQRGSNSLEDKR